jgi:hypothetical protein
MNPLARLAYDSLGRRDCWLLAMRVVVIGLIVGVWGLGHMRPDLASLSAR